MKKYLEALWEGFGIAFCGFGMLVSPMFAIYVFVKVVPKLPGWWAAGTAIVACLMFAAGIGAMIHTGLEEIDKDADAKFVMWFFNSAKQEYIEIYKQWLKERK